MAIATTTLIAIAAVTATVASIDAQQDAKSAARKSAEEQRKAQQEQKAANTAAAAAERRKQVREERVRRARILQSAENTGTAGSSGEAGAMGSLSTQLGAGIGSNLGALQTAGSISTFQQNAANFDLESRQSQADAAMFQQLGSLAGSIFSAVPNKTTNTPTSIFQTEATRTGRLPGTQ